MTLKIERFRTRVRLSGDLAIRRSGPGQNRITEMRNICGFGFGGSQSSVEGVCFLNACEANGISVVHCSPYIREWMSLERGERKYTQKHSKDGSFGRSVRGSTANPSRRSAHNC